MISNRCLGDVGDLGVNPETNHRILTHFHVAWPLTGVDTDTLLHNIHYLNTNVIPNVDLRICLVWVVCEQAYSMLPSLLQNPAESPSSIQLFSDVLQKKIVDFTEEIRLLDTTTMNPEWGTCVCNRLTILRGMIQMMMRHSFSVGSFRIIL